MYTDDISSSHESGFIITDVPDHFGAFLITQSKKHRHRANIIKTRSFSQSNIQSFKDSLDKQYFQFINNIECPNAANNEFIKFYSNIFNKWFPARESISTRFLKRESLGLLLAT